MSDRQHGAVSANAIRNEMPSHPSWMVDNAIQHTRNQEARGHEFTGAKAAVRVYLESVGGHVADGGSYGGGSTRG